MYSVGIAYLLWFLSGFGALGFHRFYLGKIPTGILWMVSGGLGMIGAIYDFFTLPTQVEAANFKLLQQKQMQNSLYALNSEKSNLPAPETIALRLARANNGTVTPSLLAMEANIDIDKSKSVLEKLVAKQVAEIRVTRTGTICYCFPEFIRDESQFEQI
ncbi:MAG TPA: TM2 domain-containing protein [Spirochaetia bacterium]|nr:TM2 domain-containing protein [Spirochaetales bacterium]HRS64807.1 TM2 domain-containing protein [Spirochaetia bacterium]HOT60244.1 TM2 domain-containing protein [Spirochaetales bacterium]HPD79472.1 TM2 domain-containing protein [Spirochaetales bacterium]HQK33119.1 TM2 domain-containing protein [Spirochaetales bacterium]